MSTGSNRSTVDVRGPRFSARVTTAVLIVVLVSGSAVLLGLQAVVFAIGAFGGLRRSPYGQVFRRLIAPRLGPPTHRAGGRSPVSLRPRRRLDLHRSWHHWLRERARCTRHSGHRHGAGRGIPLPRSVSAWAARCTCGCPRAYAHDWSSARSLP